MKNIDIDKYLSEGKEEELLKAISERKVEIAEEKKRKAKEEIERRAKEDKLNKAKQNALNALKIYLEAETGEKVKDTDLKEILDILATVHKTNKKEFFSPFDLFLELF